MHRRTLLIAALTLAAPLGARAQSRPAAPPSVEVGRLFPYLSNYLRLPPSERSRFAMAYYVTLDERPYGGTIGALIDGTTRTPLTSAASGRVERLPTLAQISARRRVEFPAGPSRGKFGMTLRLEPTLRPASELSAPELAATVTQAAAGARKAAGLLRIAVPRLTKIRFRGGAGGDIVLADGRTAPLKTDGPGGPVFLPAEHPTARTIRFRTAPAQMSIE